MGLFGKIGKTLNTVDPETGLSWADRINAMSGVVNEDPNAYANLQKLGMGRKAAAQNQQMINSVITDPRERVLYMTNPEAWAKARASAYEAANVSGGDSRYIPGSGFMTAPKLVEDAGIYGTQTPDGYQSTGARGPSIGEQQTAQRDQADYIAKMTPEGFLPRTDEQGRVVGFDLDPNFKSFALQRAASGATRVNVPITLPAQNKFAEAFATQYAQDLSKSREDADVAASSLDTLKSAKNMLGNMFTGAMAEQRLALGKLGAPVNPALREKVANTEAFQSVMGQQVLNIAKQLGAGTGISNADREFAAKVAGGSINLDKNTIDRLIGIQQRSAEARIKKFQQRGAEAFGSVPSAQGLPPSAFRGPTTGAADLKKKYGLE